VIRGTIAQFRFKLPYKKGDLQWATIKFWQPGNDGTTDAPLPITKRLEHCIAPEDVNELCVELTVAETLRFSDKLKARVQLRAQTVYGITFARREQLITVYPIYDGIIDDPTYPGADEDGLIIFDGQRVVTGNE
jgi:hypothetical protein